MGLIDGGDVMKKMIRLAIWTLLFTLLYSCTRIENTISEDLALYPAEIGVNILSEGGTKAYLGDSEGETTPIYWSDDESDEINVKIDGVDYIFKKVGVTESSQSARFRCEAAPAVEAGKTYTATYSSDGFNGVGFYQNGTKSALKDYIDLSSSYTAVEGDTWEDVLFNFEMEHALVKITVKSTVVMNRDVTFELRENVVGEGHGTGVVTSTSSTTRLVYDEVAGCYVSECYFAMEPRSYQDVVLELTVFIDNDVNPFNFSTRTFRYDMSDITMEKNNIYYVEKNIVEDATPPQILNIVKLSGEDNTSTANSYIVNPVEGEDNTFYSIYAKYKGNSTSALDEIGSQIKSVKVLWESDGTNGSIGHGDIITKTLWHNDYIYFDLNVSGKKGNALIGAYDSEENIVWSWHIWVTDTPAAHEYINYSSVHFGTYMDRNLGALTATPGEAGIAGLLYQWGRKDPFLTSGDIASATPNTVASSVLSEDMQWMVIPSSQVVGTVAFATKNPTTFITGVSPNYSWLHTPDISLWGNDKTIYDPCPAGWKVAQSELGVNLGVIFEVDKPVFTFGCGKIPYDRPNLKYAYYPASGHLHFQRGNLEYVSKVGFIWSSTVASNGSSYGFMFDENTAVDFDYKFYSSQGASVRCQKIE